MADPAHEQTEDMLREIERRVRREYLRAYEETQAKLEDYLSRFEAKDRIHAEAVERGEETAAEYARWRKGQILVGKRWQETVDTLAEDYRNADRVAASIVNGYTPDAYALNHDYATFQVEQGSRVDTSYTLYDRATVERLLRDDPDLLPVAKVDGAKDLAWNRRHVVSAVTQGILQGESLPKVAQRLRTVAGMDFRASMRTARTTMTSAQNAGRADAYRRAQGMGIQVRKQWMATLDMRTRHAHRRLDGETVSMDERFSNGLRYPGDPYGEAGEVYNCRCTLVPDLPGVDDDVPRNSKLGDMSYEEWKSYGIRRKSEEQPTGGRELTSDEIRSVVGAFDAASVLDIGFKDYEGDLVGKALAEATGAAGKPKSAASVDDLGDGFIVTYRGFSGSELADQFVDGDYWCGQGISGCGSYTSVEPSTAMDYAGGDAGSVVAVGIPSSAKIIDKADLKRMVREDDSLSGDVGEIISDDIGRWGVAHGYDAIRVPRSDGDFYVVLNRSVVTVVRRPDL